MDKRNSTPQFSLDKFPEAITYLLLRIDALEEQLQQRSLSPTAEKPVNTKELCEFLNLTEQSIIRFRKRNIIPFFTVGSAIRYNLPEVVAALEKRKK